jgi:hypothetical protein
VIPVCISYTITPSPHISTARVQPIRSA